jgi:ABC-type glycerol-3-phosphate transport system substrate-binding protein
MDIMMPDAYIKSKGLGYSTLGDRYIPKGLIGLNSTSKEEKLAKQFISFLFTKDIQDTNLYDGLPMLQSSLQKWFNEENPGIFISMKDENGNGINAAWPEKKRREEYLKQIQNVKTPIICNQILNDMIIEHALLYLTGKEDINQATAAICTKVDTYLAE